MSSDLRRFSGSGPGPQGDDGDWTDPRDHPAVVLSMRLLIALMVAMSLLPLVQGVLV